VRLAGGLRQPIDIRVRVIPADANRRMVAILHIARRKERTILALSGDVLFESEAAIAAAIPGAVDEGGVLVAGHLEAADRDRLTDRDLVLRSFVGAGKAGANLLRAGTHQELAGGKHHHVGAVLAFPEEVFWLQGAFLRQRQRTRRIWRKRDGLRRQTRTACGRARLL